ncbi:MAG: hypothetical protein ABL962_19335 [Fimbriimonadaceae bacterium]
MPLSLEVNHREYAAHADRIRDLAAHVPAFANNYQVLLTEMLVLQAFYLFESAIENIAAKIVCGAPYVDGSVPVVLRRARTIDDALNDMRTVGRAKPKGLLKWNKPKEIIGNVRHLIHASENLCTVCKNHAASINEIRIVRNHIAHNNDGTRRDFAKVVTRRLTARPRRLPRPGAFLLREFTPGTTLLVEYVVTLGVLVKDAARA